MADDTTGTAPNAPQPPSEPFPPSSSSSNVLDVPNPPTPPHDRGELLSHARSFLVSPQVMHQDVAEKRRFLVEKGLNESEISSLISELPPQRPLIPPRTYPQPPPSKLPVLLLGLVRVFSWVAGGSAVLIFIYYRFLLPRIIRTTAARHSLKAHHLSLLGRLNTSLVALKESHTETFKILPRPDPYKESSDFQKCSTVADILAGREGEAPSVEDVPSVSLLRCAWADFAEGKDGDSANPTTTELFQYLEDQIPWLVTEEGLRYEEKLWDTLSNSPLFDQLASTPDGLSVQDAQSARWTFVPPVPSEPSPVAKSLDRLAAAMPRKPATKQSSYQHTLQALSDFTGYLTTQIYLPYRSSSSSIGGYFNTGSTTLGPAEEEFKKEVRALKGLVLNRRSFMPTIPSALSTP